MRIFKLMNYVHFSGSHYKTYSNTIPLTLLTGRNKNYVLSCIYSPTFTTAMHISTTVKICCARSHPKSNRSNFNVASVWEDEESDKTPHDSREMLSTLKTESIRQEDFLLDELILAQKRVEKLNNEDWERIKLSTLDKGVVINNNNIDAVIMSKCANINSLALGKAFFKYMKSTQKQINRAVYGNYLRLFYDCSSQCSEMDLNEVDTIYKELLDVHPILDPLTAEKAVCALSLTKNWKEYEKLFEIIGKFYANPSLFLCAVVVKTAFKNKEFDLGWKLMTDFQLQCLNIHDSVYLYWLETVQEFSNIHKLTRVLEFMREFNIKPSDKIGERVKQMFEESSKERSGAFTTILKSGHCRNCHGKLQQSLVSSKDYNELKNAFLNPVLIGKDIFRKTRPEEFKNFLQFLKSTAPYNIVLDGLNISMRMHDSKKSPEACSQQLSAVVRYFSKRMKKVLVLGRKHMSNWPKKHMQHVYDNAAVFLADDLSQDDPFLLYAALYSGLGTCFVSRDLMRSHNFLLQDPKLQSTFLLWQAQHQFFIRYVEDNGNVSVLEPVAFLQSIQRNPQGDWHIPYKRKEILTNKSHMDNYHPHWLCLLNRRLESSLKHKDNSIQTLAKQKGRPLQSSYSHRGKNV